VQDKKRSDFSAEKAAKLKALWQELAAEKQAAAELERKAAEEAAERENQRRKQHNDDQDRKGAIRVLCRVRMAEVAAGAGPKLAVEVLTDDVEQRRLRVDQGGIKSFFTLDRVFPPGTSQSEVFEEVAGLVQSVLDGYNVVVFAYGQTGSGKTYTMQGDGGIGESGIIPRSVELLFKVKKEMERHGWGVKVVASCLEIYNDSIHDLLDKGARLGGKNCVKHSPAGDTMVANMKEKVVVSETDVQRLLAQAVASRSTTATKMNENSSRSHSVFQLRVNAVDETSGIVRNGHLVLVDLAGSEKIGKSGVKGAELKETIAINTSLFHLKSVIVALGKKQKAKKQSHVPFCNSTLTFLLQNCLSGDSKVLMIVNVSPSADSVAETLNSLSFAAMVNATEVGVAEKHGSYKNSK